MTRRCARREWVFLYTLLCALVVPSVATADDERDEDRPRLVIHKAQADPDADKFSGRWTSQRAARCRTPRLRLLIRVSLSVRRSCLMRCSSRSAALQVARWHHHTSLTGSRDRV